MAARFWSGRKEKTLVNSLPANARLQGFPDEFIIPVSDTQAYRQFGNSVTVPVVRSVAKLMMEVF